MIEIKVETAAGVSRAWVKRVLGRALKYQKVSNRGLSVLLTGNKKIRAINKQYLGHDYATDVISFGLDEKDFLGDIVVSVEMARRKAKELGLTYKEELARYLIHGVLHLLGYKDKTKKDYLIMHKRQEKILRWL